MNKKIIVALDNNKIKENLEIINHLKKEAFAFKIGYEFFYNFGLEGYNLIKNNNIKIFLDLKLHDIPNTVGKAVEAITKLDPYFLTIHLSGGDEMQRLAILVKKNIKIIGVSILTSLNSDQTAKYYFNRNIQNIVSQYTNSALKNKIDGIVCSPKEIFTIKEIAKNKLIIITPGIRPINYHDQNDDQKRTMTPREAINAGANYLVIGRPIIKSEDPLTALKLINSSLD